MSFFYLDPRSDNDYGDSDGDAEESLSGCSFILWLPVAVVVIFVLSFIPVLLLAAYFFHDVYTTTKRTAQTGELAYPLPARLGVVLALILAVAFGDAYRQPISLSLGLVVALGFVVIFTVLPYAALGWHSRGKIRSALKTGSWDMQPTVRYLISAGLLLGVVVLLIVVWRAAPAPGTSLITPLATRKVLPTVTPLPASARNAAVSAATPNALPAATALMPGNTPPAERSFSILLDDFSPQPYQGETIYFFNRLDGDRGAVNNSVLEWDAGEVTTTIGSGSSWGGVWFSLNHPIREGQSIDFSAVLPEPIRPVYQSRITGLLIRIARGTPQTRFRLELKQHGDLQWKSEIELSGGAQTIGLELPPLSRVNEFLWVLDRAQAGAQVVVDSVSFTATTAITDTATAAFVWSYGQLLNNWNPATGLARDKAKDASGEFDAIQVTGSLAAATASAAQLGIIDRAAAITIVQRIEQKLLSLPRWHGLWPHWVRTSPAGDSVIVPGTEWSSVDTVIAAIGLLDAQSGLGLDTSRTEQFLQAIDWADLMTAGGISHGYATTGDRLPYAWDVFGGESWLVELAYASATGQIAPLTYPTPPTANGSGFIDELAWLLVRPPDRVDYWGTDWTAYRRSAAEKQIAYYAVHHPIGCAGDLGFFGLSAAEVPAPARVPPASIYQAYGVGGRFAAANDGRDQAGTGVVVPHYAALIAALYPQAASRLWEWLMAQSYFTPLTNVESFSSGPACEPALGEWNSLKGSWNLALQTLGWGRYLAQRNGQTPVVWQASLTNAFLQRGYKLLVPDPTVPAVTSPLPTP
jgi:hypothetical protein